MNKWLLCGLMILALVVSGCVEQADNCEEKIENALTGLASSMEKAVDQGGSESVSVNLQGCKGSGKIELREQGNTAMCENYCGEKSLCRLLEYTTNEIIERVCVRIPLNADVSNNIGACKNKAGYELTNIKDEIPEGEYLVEGKPTDRQVKALCVYRKI